MNPSQQRQAQQRVDHIAAFRTELAQLERESALLLTPEQRAGLAAHHERLLDTFRREYAVDIDDSTRRISWGMRVVSLLGAVAFFVGLVLFLHRFWGLAPLGIQVGVLVAVPAALLVATAWCSRRSVAGYYVGLLALATGAAFVMGLSALGGLLNLAPTPHALVAWGGFAMALAYGSGFRLLLVCGGALLAGYVGACGTAAGGAFWGSFMERPFWVLPAAAVLYLLPGLIRHPATHDFDVVYRATGAGLTLVSFLVLSFGGDVCCAAPMASTVQMLYQLAGLGVGAAVATHGLRLGRGALVNLGSAGFVVFLVVRLHSWLWDWMPKYLFCACLGLLAILLLVLFRRLRARLSARDDQAAAGPKEPCGAAPASAGPPARPWATAALTWGLAALILLASNVGGIVSALRNRSAAPGGTLELSEHELAMPGLFQDSTVMLLELRWAARPALSWDRHAPTWLTPDKLAALGFDTAEPTTSAHARDHYRAMPPRAVHVVLELDGASPEQPDRDRSPRTRLAAVDAGLDPTELRRKYPDTRRQAIVRALVRPTVWTYDAEERKPLAEPHFGGRIQELHPGLLFVPRPHSDVLQKLDRRTTAERTGPPGQSRYAATVSWGAHFEPWVREIRSLPAGAATAPEATAKP